MRITKAMIDKAARKSACEEALCWLREKSRTLDGLYRFCPEWLYWAVRKKVISARLAKKYLKPKPPFPYKVRLRGNTALMESKTFLKAGMEGVAVWGDSDDTIGVDLGKRFDGHSLGGRLLNPTGYWFYPHEIERIPRRRTRK